MRCHVRIGRLVSHPCARASHERCPRCSEPMCERHRDAAGACVVCAGTHTPPRAPTSLSLEELMTFSEAELAAFDATGHARAGKLGDLDS